MARCKQTCEWTASVLPVPSSWPPRHCLPSDYLQLSLQPPAPTYHTANHVDIQWHQPNIICWYTNNLLSTVFGKVITKRETMYCTQKVKENLTWTDVAKSWQYYKSRRSCNMTTNCEASITILCLSFLSNDWAQMPAQHISREWQKVSEREKIHGSKSCFNSKGYPFQIKKKSTTFQVIMLTTDTRTLEINHCVWQAEVIQTHHENEQNIILHYLYDSQ